MRYARQSEAMQAASNSSSGDGFHEFLAEIVANRIDDEMCAASIS